MKRDNIKLDLITNLQKKNWDLFYENIHRMYEGAQSRDLLVQLDLATERRLRHNILAYNEEIDENDDPYSDEDIAFHLVSIASCGLHEAESERGEWSLLDGEIRPLPRRRRASFWTRLKITAKHAKQTWKAN